jgi:hypothetical protein
MYFLDSDLRDRLADYTFDPHRERAEKGPVSPAESAGAGQLNWAARVQRAMARRTRGKLRTEGRTR